MTSRNEHKLQRGREERRGEEKRSGEEKRRGVKKRQREKCPPRKGEQQPSPRPQTFQPSASRGRQVFSAALRHRKRTCSLEIPEFGRIQSFDIFGDQNSRGPPFWNFVHQLNDMWWCEDCGTAARCSDSQPQCTAKTRGYATQISPIGQQ